MDNFVGINTSIFANVLLKTDSLGNGACDGINYTIAISSLNQTVTNNALLSNSGTSQYYATSLINYTLTDSTVCETINDSIVLNTESFLNNKYNLSQNYPNPFSTQTTIEYSLGYGAKNVSIAIYNILGSKRYEKNNLPYTSGKHIVNIENLNLSSGIYFYSIFIDGIKITKKMIIER